MTSTLKRIHDWKLIESWIPKSASFQEGEHHYLVHELHGVFSVARTIHSEEGVYPVDFTEGQLYQPPAPHTQLKDVRSAIHAEDDGDYWHLTAATPDQHRALEASIEAMLVSHFQPLINAQNIAVHGGATINDRTLELNKLKYLQEAADRAQENAQTAVRELWLGQHVQEGKHDYAREVAVAATKKAVTDLTAVATSNPLVRFNLPFVTSQTSEVVKGLSADPAYKTRMQVAAAAAAAEAED